MEIPVGRKGHVTLVDPEDAHLAAYSWCLVGGKRTTVRYAYNRALGYMHRHIINAPSGVSIDHRNGDGLDNRRSNLRIAGQSNNTAAADFKRGRSGYRGVHWSAQDGKWRGQIKVKGKKFHLGVFIDPVHAARAYDRAAVEHFGEFAFQNFPLARAQQEPATAS
jgi:hypothetical protein